MSRRPPLAPLLTPWGEELDPDRPLPEYPRPQLVRDSYLNLNGRWEYAFRGTVDEPAVWDGEIVVPFPPESLLSGVGRVLRPDEVLHYRLSWELPDGFVPPGERLLLHLDAVDQWCEVRVNGTRVAEHDGGSLPVICDITDAVRPGANELRVIVRDPTDTGQASRGKQVLDPGGIWYTPHSGIWQTVWLEAVPPGHVERLELVPDIDSETVSVIVRWSQDVPGPAVQVRVSADGAEVATATGAVEAPVVVSLPDARRWSPDDPHLYDLEITVGSDVVRSYVGMRSFGVGPDSTGLPRLLLNGESYLHVGVLDQGYWSDGLVTAPSDEALIHDIRTMKDLGFTMLRKHIKIEPLRWYHHCDRLGILVWQDMVNGGGHYSPVTIGVPAVTPWRLKDSHYRAFARTDADGRSHWLTEMRETVDHLRNVVSLAVWVPFNEGWGQFDSLDATAEIAALDPTRQIDHASGWHDQGGGDLTSLHVYFRPFRVPRRRRATRHRVLALTEYGGYSRRLPEHSVSEREFGYRRYGSAAELSDAFRRLHERQLVPAVPRGLGATVYTQLSDVEDETNGLLTYDRRVLKFPADVVREVTAALREAMP
ncbi:MAG: glycoside hydrolase family 2 TIM barrel-domain containing protein [Candidatus Nanopelagicales bacterium]